MVLWPFRARELGSAWRAAAKHLKVGELSITPCQSRHGGPSRDIQVKSRTLAEAQKRGHWKECRLAFADADPQCSWQVARTL